MTIRFECECGRTLRIADGFAGKRARCPACQRAITIPEASVDSYGIGEEGNREEWQEETPQEEAFSEERQSEGDEGPIEEELQAQEEESQKEGRGWFRSPRFLGLAIVLVVLLVVVIVFMLMGQKEETPEQVVIFQKVTPEESEEAKVLPAEAEPKEEASLVEDVSPIEGLTTEEESTEEVVVETPSVEREETAQEVAETKQETEQRVASLEQEPNSIEEPAPLAGSYTINVGSFRERERADRFVLQLKEKGVEAFRWEIDLPDKGKWHRVSIGNFVTRKEAKDFVAEKKLEDSFRFFIVRIPGA